MPRTNLQLHRRLVRSQSCGIAASILVRCGGLVLNKAIKRIESKCNNRRAMLSIYDCTMVFSVISNYQLTFESCYGTSQVACLFNVVIPKWNNQVDIRCVVILLTQTNTMDIQHTQNVIACLWLYRVLKSTLRRGWNMSTREEFLSPDKAWSPHDRVWIGLA